jgi:hypothetical protein
MMTELLEAPEHSRFRYSTLSNHLPGGNWTHPNNGSREYGYFKTLDGWTKFYVRGIDQFDFEKAADLGAETSQSNFWLNFLTGIGNQVKFRKGEIVYPAFKTVDETLKGPPKCHVPPRTGYGA